jgi:Fanconi anemia group M protein
MKEILKYLNNIEPRKYQAEIFNTCIKNNTLVILPTGLGKTLIALMLSIKRQIDFPGEKIVFLAPTRPLAEQHLVSFKKNLPELFAQMELFTGKTKADKRQELWQNADIIFSTPQCISNDLKKRLYDLNDVSLLIEDECHRCIKNYSYTYIAQTYKDQAKNPRILGLTASPGHQKENIDQICSNLDIEAVEVRTRDSEDVKPYLQDLKFNLSSVDFPDEFNQIKGLIKLILDRKITELKNRKLLFGPPTKVNLLETQHKLMRSIASGNKHFNILSGASVCAQAIKLQHAIELLETQTLYSLNSYLLDLVRQASANKSKAVQNLVRQQEFVQARERVSELMLKDIEHPKIARLIELIKKRKNKRILVFAQYRDTVLKICKEINKLGIPAKTFIGQAKKGQGKEQSGLTQKEQQDLIREFTLGNVQVLVSTSIGEEGLDIPEVSAVIFYEPVPSAIRKIQRAGRTARLNKGELIILMTKKTRDEAYHWAAFNKEKRMYKALENIKDSLIAKNNANNQENSKTKEQKALGEWLKKQNKNV